MAAIIAQMAAANRERKKRKMLRDEVPPSKSVRSLPMFDRCFDPTKHNKFVIQALEKQKRREILDLIQARKLEEENIQRKVIEENRWKKQLANSLHLIKPHTNPEAQMQRLHKKIRNRDKRYRILVEVMKASVGLLSIAFFALIMTYIYFYFRYEYETNPTY